MLRCAILLRPPAPGSARKRRECTQSEPHRVSPGQSKFFGDFQALEDIDFTVDEGEVVVVIGPSGSRKSTLLRCINGLEGITSGELVVDGMQLHKRTTSLNELRSEIGMVFQQFDLYPHGCREHQARPNEGQERLGEGGRRALREAPRAGRYPRAG